MTREPITVLGMISGTSVDALDAAVVRIAEAGDTLTVTLLHYHEAPVEPGLRARVHALFDPARSRIDEVCQVNALLGQAFADAGAAAIAGAGLATVDLVASHGQTVWHEVTAGRTRSTLQLGEPSELAERLGTTVIADFRPRDIAAGGEAAPLASYPDVLLFTDPTASRAIQNLGGIGNVTWVPSIARGGEAFAFDTGPANVLIDAAIERLTGGARTYDRDGALAAAGHADEPLIDQWLSEPYFDRRPPKTTGRELFGAQMVGPMIEAAKARGLGAADIVATLTLYTARSVADQYARWLPEPPDEVVVGGGGSRNPVLMAHLARLLAPARLLTHEDFALPSVGREAIYFAVLGYQALHGRPNTLPGCTGAHHAVSMGKLLPGPNYHTLLRAALDAPPAMIRRLRIEGAGDHETVAAGVS